MSEHRGKKSTQYKNRYNAKAYDSLRIIVPKGQKATVKAAAEGVQESVNLYTQKALLQRIGVNDWPALDAAQEDPADHGAAT